MLIRWLKARYDQPVQTYASGAVAAGLAAVLLTSGCRSSHEPPRPRTRELIEMARLARLDGLLTSGADDSAERRAARRLEQIARRVDAALAGKRNAGAVDVLNRVVFQELGFSREVKDDALRFTLLPQVLEGRRGGCLGLSGLYLALGERLGLRLQGVLVPGHFFVRFVGPGGPRSIELLKRGRQMSRGWYVRKYGVPADHPLYLRRGLTWRQTLTVYRYNLANAHRTQGSLRDALTLYKRVARELPDFAEAHANLGLTLHRLGRLPEARRAYIAAQRAHPNLTGLEHNLKALQQQQ